MLLNCIADCDVELVPNNLQARSDNAAMTQLYKVTDGKLFLVGRHSLQTEEQLENWIAEDLNIINLDVLLVGRQVSTDFKGRIDLLAMDREGNLTIIELKRDRTPRDVIAQVLDYASWVSKLSTREVHEIASAYLKRPLEDAFRERFERSVPETLNGSHNMIVVASEFDASSKRIVEYLAERHGLGINTAFFSVFQHDGATLLATDWLMDQQEVVERSEGKTKRPWTGYYYVNAGHDPTVRDWEDMREFGFVSAGYGPFYSTRLNQLSEGDPIYVYQKSYGYIGFGVVRKPSVISKDFTLVDGRHLSDVELRQPNVLHDPDDRENADYIVAVDWIKTVPLSEAKTFAGAFANQNVVCKLRHPATLEFLKSELGEK